MLTKKLLIQTKPYKRCMLSCGLLPLSNPISNKMDLYKRHGGEMHATTSIMASVTSTVEAMVMTGTGTMDMPSATSSSMNMDGHSMDGHSMDGMLMHMYFTRAYEGYPVLFSSLKANNGGQAFGIFVLIFVVAFVSKGFEFLKNYLELKVWNNPNYVVPQATTTIVENCDCDDDDSAEKVESPAIEGVHAAGKPKNLSLASVLVRDVIRLVLCFIPELLSYALMLVAMSYTLVYFFAVVAGMTVGRFFFERLSDTMGVRPGANNFQGHH